MTVSPDDVALAAVLGVVFLFARWQSHQAAAAERESRENTATADRKHALALARLRLKAPATVPAVTADGQPKQAAANGGQS